MLKLQLQRRPGMTKDHVSDLRSLVSRLSEQVGGTDAVECKRFFGGAAAYVDGRIFMTLTSIGLAVKLPERDRIVLLTIGAKPLRYFPKGPIKKEYVILPDRIVKDEGVMPSLVKKSVSFVTGQASNNRRSKQRRAKLR